MGTETRTQTGAIDIPVTNAMGPVEAQAAISKISAAALADPGHPYWGKHPQAKELQETMTTLYEIKGGPPPEVQTNEAGEELVASGQWPQEHLAAMKEGLDEQAFKTEAKQEEMAKSIRADVGVVNQLMEGSDINIDEVLENPTVSQMQGYRQMALLAQGSYSELMPLLIADVRVLGMPSAQVDQVRAFLATAQPNDPLTQDLTNIIIRHINSAKKKKEER